MKGRFRSSTKSRAAVWRWWKLAETRKAGRVREAPGYPYCYMVKFLIGLATGVALVFLSIILLFVIALRFREKPPVIASDSVLVMRLEGELPEKTPVEIPAIFGGDHTPATVVGVWS